MTTSPPFPLDEIELVDEDPGTRQGKQLGPDSLAVDVDGVFECEGLEDCLRERTVSTGPHDTETTEKWFPRVTVRTFDKWDLYQCKECGGFEWVHAARRDYL